MSEYKNYSNLSSVELFIDEIEKCIDSKCYLSALHLALSIPDMLGKIFYKTQGVNYYEKWFDENVISRFHGMLYSEVFKSMPDCPRFSGEICYALRNKLFHEGTNILVKKMRIDEFVICMSDEDFVRGNVAGKEYDLFKYDPKSQQYPETSYLYISCKGLCKDIINSAKIFIKNNPDLQYPTLRINYYGGKHPRF